MPQWYGNAAKDTEFLDRQIGKIVRVEENKDAELRLGVPEPDTAHRDALTMSTSVFEWLLAVR